MSRADWTGQFPVTVVAGHRGTKRCIRSHPTLDTFLLLPVCSGSQFSLESCNQQEVDSIPIMPLTMPLMSTRPGAESCIIPSLKIFIQVNLWFQQCTQIHAYSSKNVQEKTVEAGGWEHRDSILFPLFCLCLKIYIRDKQKNVSIRRNRFKSVSWREQDWVTRRNWAGEIFSL